MLYQFLQENQIKATVRITSYREGSSSKNVDLCLLDSLALHDRKQPSLVLPRLPDSIQRSPGRSRRSHCTSVHVTTHRTDISHN